MIKILTLLILGVLALILFQGSEGVKEVCFEIVCFEVEVAESSLEKTQGLMFRESLSGGMLFVYETEDDRNFWMKNMKIPLDIVWINEKLEVVSVSRNAQPCLDECVLISEVAKYVLEINAGNAKRYSIKKGDKIELFL
jgi:uncharacterized protein